MKESAEMSRILRRERLLVSLVVPMRDEEATIRRLIDSIRRQTRPPDEVVLVDGGSTDGTVELARALIGGDARFRVIEAGPATPGRGRNVGIAAARHEWAALTDAGIEPEPEWLERLLAAVSDPGTSIVYGNYEPVTDSLFKRCAALAYVPPAQLREGGRMRGPSIASSLLRRDAWRRVGGFPDLRAAEDLIFFERLEQSGAVVGWAPSATVHWQIAPTLWKTFRRFLLYSKHNVRAGRQRDWHYGVVRWYLLALPFLILSAVHSAWWLLAPAMGAGARVAKTLWRQREGRGLFWLLNPIRFALVGLILLTIDAATLLGWVQAVVTGPEAATSQQREPTWREATPSGAGSGTAVGANHLVD